MKVTLISWSGTLKAPLSIIDNADMIESSYFEVYEENDKYAYIDTELCIFEGSTDLLEEELEDLRSHGARGTIVFMCPEYESITKYELTDSKVWETPMELVPAGCVDDGYHR